MFEKIIPASLRKSTETAVPNPKKWKKQQKQLKRLIKSAKYTTFGRYYDFSDLLQAPQLPTAFQQQVPIHTYDDLYEQWWQYALEDEPDITWPGVVPYYALSSGTSGGASKYIPVTKEMLKSMKKGSRKVFLDLASLPIPKALLRKEMLMVGSCTQLQTVGAHQVGDLSGIIGLNRPKWIKRYYKPTRAITDLPDWGQRIQAIVEAAPTWDIGFVLGNPAWIQLIFEKIIAHYQLKNIHEMWPNLSVFIHGGVFFEPYKTSFERLLAHELVYLDSYMASEGFIAYQGVANSNCMELLVDTGIYYEFIPFDSYHFDDEGNVRLVAKTLNITQIQPKTEYALLISTCAGAWRYLIGDTIQFTDIVRLEFRITGRTKQFLSVCGEHLSIDNLNQAVSSVNKHLKAGIKEFAVAGIKTDQGWKHQWYLSLDHVGLSANQLMEALDEELCLLNDDYATERRYALHEVSLEIVPHEFFYQWLEKRGKLNGQAKIPRVLKGTALSNWQEFLEENKVKS